MKQVLIEHGDGLRRANVMASTVAMWIDRGWHVVEDGAPVPEPVVAPDELHARDASTQPSDVTAPGESIQDVDSVPTQGEE